MYPKYSPSLSMKGIEFRSNTIFLFPANSYSKYDPFTDVNVLSVVEKISPPMLI